MFKAIVEKKCAKIFKLSLILSFFAYCNCIFICNNIFLFANPTNQNEVFKDGILVKHSDINSLHLSFSPEFEGFDTLLIENSQYLKPKIKNCFPKNNLQIGSPAEILKTVMITVPDSNSFTVENYTVEGTVNYFGKIAPFKQDILGKNTDYEVDNSLYNSHKLTPWISVEYFGIAGCRHIAQVTFVAARYNSITSNIEIPKEINIKINFNSSKNANNYAKIKNDLEITINHSETFPWIVERKSKNYFRKNQKIGQNEFQSEVENINEISNGKWLRIGVIKEGLYVITAAELAAKGVTVPNNEIETIKIFGQSGKPMSEKLNEENSLNEQEIIVKTNSDGSLSKIIFYGSGAKGFEYDATVKIPRHYSNYMDNKNYYLFTYGKTHGKRANPIPTPQGEVKNKPTSYRASIFFDEDKYMPQQPGVGLHWLGDQISGNETKVDLLQNFNRKDDVFYVLSVAHNSQVADTMKIEQANEVIKNIVMTSISSDYESAKIFTNLVKVPANKIGSDNRSVLKFTYSGSILKAFHNFYEIHYPSDFVPIDNEIVFYSDIINSDNNFENQGITEYSINNFSSNSEIFGFDVTNMSNPKLLENLSNIGSSFIFRAEENPEIVKKYFISAKTNIPTIENISLEYLRDLNNEKYANSDIIVITPDEFIESANTYAEYRSKQSNVKVTVVPIKQIYNEFSYGRLELAAIRNFIQYCYNNWENPPNHIVLWGTGHYDFRGIYEPQPNYIPAYQCTDGALSKENINASTSINCSSNNFATDDFYVRIVGNDSFPDIAIGRVPIKNNSEGFNYVEKLNQYENHSNKDGWRNNVLLLADDGPTTSDSQYENDGSRHSQDAESIFHQSIPNDFVTNKIYCVTYPIIYQANGERRNPKAAEEVINQLNIAGSALWVYVGHGNTNTLTHERVFTRDMLQQFTNSDKLFFFGAASCEVGRFDHSAGCLGGDIVLLQNSGAIVSYSASRVSGSAGNTNVFIANVKNLLDKNKYGSYNTVGEASRMTKTRGTTDSETQMYILMGDPAIKLSLSNLTVAVEEINDNKIDTMMESLNIKAMSHLKIKGKIISDIDGTLQKDFNGIVSLTLNEADEAIQFTDRYDINHSFNNSGATLNKSSYKVENGEFFAELIIPGDISFNENNSILRFYATSDDNQYAKGVFNKLIINDIATTIPNDNNGPEVTVKLDSEYFISGDLVSKNPLLMLKLWDETGINTTGLGIGHKIEAWIDDNSNPIDLTNNFNSSLDDPKGGTVNKILYGISAGLHKISVRAWDVFNNFSTVETYFVIPDSDEEMIKNATLAPNPASENNNINIVINYNIPPPIVATITIFDALGNEVTNFNQQIFSQGSAIIPWNGRNSNGILAGVGTYYYRVNFEFEKTSSQSRSYEKFGTLGIISK